MAFPQVTKRKYIRLTTLPVEVFGDPALWADLAGLRVEAGDDGVAPPLPRDRPGRAAASSRLTLLKKVVSSQS